MRLVERDRGLPIEDVRWLQAQSIRSYGEVPNPANWYRVDGAFSKGPTDPYHLLSLSLVLENPPVQLLKDAVFLSWRCHAQELESPLIVSHASRLP